MKLIYVTPHIFSPEILFNQHWFKNEGTKFSK